MSSESLNTFLAIVGGLVGGLFIIIGWFAASSLNEMKRDIKVSKEDQHRILVAMTGVNKDIEQNKKDIASNDDDIKTIQSDVRMLVIKHSDCQNQIIELHKLLLK